MVLICASLFMSILQIQSSYALTPTSQQIEQFKKLSPQQQKKIAKQLGYDVGDLKGISGPQKDFQEVPDLMNPRPEAEKPLNLDEILAQFPEKNDEPQYFGYDLFAGEPTTFAPVTDIPVPSEYILGPGDELVVQLYGKENQNYNLSVYRDGKIQLPEIGPIAVSGMKYEEVKQLITKKIQSQILGVEVSISLGELRSMRILVLGDAFKPGSYQVSSLTTITNAIFVSGGIKKTGSLRNIQLKRRGKLIATLDLYDLLLKGETNQDLRLQAGDVVFIPSAGARVTAMGEVNRPAIFEIKKDENIADLLFMAGDAKAQSNKSSALLNRINANNVREAFNLNLAHPEDRKLTLRNGDELVMGKISDFIDGAVKLIGAVTREGAYHWQEGIRISDVIRDLHRDLMPDADLGYSLVVRKINIQNDINLVQFSLADALSHKNKDEFDIQLQAQDEILVFSVKDSVKYAEEFNLGKFDFKNKNKQKQLLLERAEKIKYQEKYVPQINENESEEEEKDFSRVTLLKPIIEQLKKQASLNSPLLVHTIQGEVNFPGLYPITDKNTIKSLIKAAGGFKDSAYTVAAELTRRKINTDEPMNIEHITVTMKDMISGESTEKLRLLSRDVVTVRIKPEWNEVKQVIVKGEVKFPGTYVISQGETLKDVLVRAGGLTNMAYAKGAIFLRKELKEREAELLKEMQERLKNELAAASLSEATDDKKVIKKDDSLDLVEKLDSTQVLGRLVIDLPSVLVGEKNSENNLVLKDGDEIAIPPSAQTVSVMGQVQHPTAHVFDKKLNMESYLQLSGGLTSRADEDRVFIIKANGAVRMPQNRSVWFANSSTQLEPGDTIIVPLNTNYTKPITLWSEVTQIIFQNVVALATLGRL